MKIFISNSQIVNQNENQRNSACSHPERDTQHGKHVTEVLYWRAAHVRKITFGGITIFHWK